MSKQCQTALRLLITRLVGLVVQPAVLAAIPFLANRPLPAGWIRVWAVAGLAWDVAVWAVAVNEFEFFCETVGEYLLSLRRRRGAAAVDVRPRGIRMCDLLRAFAIYKGMTFLLALLAIYFAAALRDPETFTQTTEVGVWLLRAFASFSVMLTLWTTVALAGCNKGSWGVLVATHRVPLGTQFQTFDRSVQSRNLWIIRLETAAICFNIAGSLLAVMTIFTVYKVATANAVVNVIYFYSYHSFLRAAYNVARSRFSM